MMKLIKRWPLLVALYVGSTFAQETYFYTDLNRNFREGVQLFDEKNYASARMSFERLAKIVKPNDQNDFQLLKEEATYYTAVSAAENNDADAEILLLQFSKNYPSSSRKSYADFFLGRYYYQNNKYQECIDKLGKLTVSDIPEMYRDDFQFQLGYCYFVKKRFDEAKPLFRAIKDKKEKYYYPSNYYYAFICFYQKNYKEALKSFTAIEDSKMFSSVIPYYVSQIHYQSKDYNKTTTYIKEHIDKVDGQYRDEMNHLLGESYFQLSDYKKALPYLEKFVTTDSKVRKEDIYELGYSQYKLGEYRKASENLLQLNLVDEKIGQNATYTLGDCYLKLGEKENARAAFQSAASKDFDLDLKQQAQFNFAKLSLELGNPAECVTALENLLSSKVNKDIKEEANSLMAVALLQTKDYSRALTIIEGMNTISPSLKEAYQKLCYYRAVQLFNDNKQAETKALLDKSLKYPINQEVQAGAYYLQGDINYQEKNYRTAIANYQRYSQLNSPKTEATVGFSDALANYNTAYSYFQLKEYGQAQTFFKKYLSADRITTAMQNDAQLRLAECAFINKDYPTSLTNYTAVSKSTSEDAEYAHFQKAIVLGLSGRTADKIAELKVITQSYTNSKTIDKTYYEIGETYLNNDDMKDAIANYKRVINDYPSSALVPSAYSKIALAEYNLGNKEEAIKQYKTLLNNYPTSSQAKAATLSIKQLGVELGRPELYAELANISQSEKDSLTYYAAETAFTNGDCTRAIELYTNYITKFKKGFFLQDAHFNRADCLLKNKQYAQILEDYDYLIANAAELKEKALLNASGISFFELKDYKKATQYYNQLENIATTPQNRYTAILGQYKSAQKMEEPQAILTTADKVLNLTGAKESDLTDAHYTKAKTLYSLKNNEQAFIHFSKVSNGVVSERAAESKFYTAKILNEKLNYKASLDSCFKIKNKFASYEYWYVKSFILMADNYYRLNNMLQAKATLESIIANYKGDEALITDAQRLLEEIKASETIKSRLDLSPPTDTLKMQQPDILIDTLQQK